MGHKSSKTAQNDVKLQKDCKLRILLAHLNKDLDFNLEEIYLNAPKFSLSPKGGKLTQLKHPVRWGRASLYIGECCDSFMHGLGYLITEKGWFYEGYFEKGKFHGLGRLFTSKMFIIEGIWEKGDILNGKILNFKKKTYEGQLKNFEPNGYGTEIAEDYTYKGEFIDGKKHGTGKVEWKDGTWYEGEFVQGKIEGTGKYHWLDSEYTGEWKAGKMHGKGIYTWNDGRKYEGSLVCGQREGFGIFIDQGKKYSGFWKAGKEDGQGKLEENGEITEGIWMYGKLNQSIFSDKSSNKKIDFNDIEIPSKVREKCKAVIQVWENKAKFRWDSETYLCDDKWYQIGKGVYCGQLNGDKIPEGKGIYINSSSIYEGSFSSGKKEGFGRLINNQGEVYNGDWVKDKKCGFGVLFKEDSVYVGEWSQDKFNGQGKIQAPSFSYDGTWKNGFQHGEGVMEYPDKTVFVGKFVKGEVKGEGILKYPNRKCIKGIWEDGKMLKVVEKYYEDSESGEESEADILDSRNMKEIRKLLVCQ